ncbi:MAG: integrase core domain-containing protein [Bryobacteraceae bacterium]|nr:integrase core domain-containing protein [Bryobacteraceae bacterium]
MPWKESSVMDERMRFVVRLKDGESMAALCREFNISRKTGYKIFERYEECGLEGLSDRTRRPFRYANQLPEQIEAAIVAAKREKPNWGAGKIRERLLRRLPHGVRVPACSTIHAVLDRHGLVTHPVRSRTRTEGTPLSEGLGPNDLWCTDYKGEFMLGDKRYCYPLTVTDHASRYLLLCEAMESNAEKPAFTAFERLFKERGLPWAIRSDNGVPFASPNGLFNLSKLSVWWLRLGISIERIKPGHPQQNGRHERMHLTFKKEATRPAGANILQQQAKFDDFIEEFNNQRPHEALAMKCPVELYTASTRPYQGLPEPHYPLHDKTVVVTCCGRLCLYRKKINLSKSLAGQAVGVKEVDNGIWLVSFMDYDLGYVDLEEKTLQPLENPFGPKCVRNGQLILWSGRRDSNPRRPAWESGCRL